jgi:hypothetical protein
MRKFERNAPSPDSQRRRLTQVSPDDHVEKQAGSWLFSYYTVWKAKN